MTAAPPTTPPAIAPALFVGMFSSIFVASVCDKKVFFVIVSRVFIKNETYRYANCIVNKKQIFPKWLGTYQFNV